MENTINNNVYTYTQYTHAQTHVDETYADMSRMFLMQHLYAPSRRIIVGPARAMEETLKNYFVSLDRRLDGKLLESWLNQSWLNTNTHSNMHDFDIVSFLEMHCNDFKDIETFLKKIYQQSSYHE